MPSEQVLSIPRAIAAIAVPAGPCRPFCTPLASLAASLRSASGFAQDPGNHGSTHVSLRSVAGLPPLAGHACRRLPCRRLCRHSTLPSLAPFAGCCIGPLQTALRGERRMMRLRTRLPAWAARRRQPNGGARRRRHCGEWRGAGLMTCPRLVRRAAKPCRCIACRSATSQTSCFCCPSELQDAGRWKGGRGGRACMLFTGPAPCSAVVTRLHLSTKRVMLGVVPCAGLRSKWFRRGPACRASLTTSICSRWAAYMQPGWGVGLVEARR